jgi:hypothetical protein
MTKKEALAFIYSHGTSILAEDLAEEIAQAFGHSLEGIGIKPMVLTATSAPRRIPGWEGRLTVAMPYLAAALAGMGSLPSQATEGLWNAISQLSAEAIERGHGFEAGPDVEQIKLHVHFEVHDEGKPVQESGETTLQFT